MIIKLKTAIGRSGPNKRKFMVPEHLPCGCKVVGHAQVIGIDGLPVPGVQGINTKTGWIRVMRYVVEPSLMETTREGVEPVDCVAPFELRCKNHGPVRE